MKDLFEKTKNWLAKHKCRNNVDSEGENQKNKFYNKKIEIAFSTYTIDIILFFPFFKIGFKSENKHSKWRCASGDRSMCIYISLSSSLLLLYTSIST